MIVPLGAMQTDPLQELLHRGVAAVADPYIRSQFELGTQKFARPVGRGLPARSETRKKNAGLKPGVQQLFSRS